MTVSKLHAALTAIALGTATVGVVSIIGAAPALAVTVSAKVGPLLQEAQSLAQAGNYKAANAKLDQADKVKSTPDDATIIEQLRHFIAVKSGDTSTKAGAQAKFANDYNARNYKAVIADGEALRKVGALDAKSMQIIAQSYYLDHNYNGCIRYIQSNLRNPSNDVLELLMRCAYEDHDDKVQRQALETLVARTNNSKYWGSLIKLTENARGLSDHNTLDINRLRFMTGNVTAKDEYTLLAQLAMQMGFPAEAVTVLEKGVSAKVLTDDRSMKLLALAKKQAAQSTSDQAKNLAAAKKEPQGDALIRVGENMIGEGNAKDAIAIIKEGMEKPLKDKANAELRLGQAYLAAGQKSAAVKAFDSVKTPEKDAMIAHLWSLYARH
jgi:hypothetical protein